MNKILIGSQYFFSCYDDFKGKDVDEIQIIETTDFAQMRQLTRQGERFFQMKKHNSKEDYINWAVQSSVGMAIRKFLVPEFCTKIGFTIEDLPKFKVLLEGPDDNHKYEEIIYNSYLESNSFTLTSKRCNRAYESYKKYRGE